MSDKALERIAGDDVTASRPGILLPAGFAHSYTSHEESYRVTDLVRILVHRRWFMLYAFLAIMIPAVLVIMLMPPLYQANATVLVKRQASGADYSVKAAGGEASTNIRNIDRREEINTRAELVRNRVNVEHVIGQLSIDTAALEHIRDYRRYVFQTYKAIRHFFTALYEETTYFTGLATRPTPEQKRFLDGETLVADVTDRIRVTPGADTTILEIGFRGSDPYLAMKAANAVAEFFVASASTTRDTQALALFTSQAESKEAELRRTEAALAEARRQGSAYAVEEQRKQLLSSLAQIEGQRKSAQAARAGTEARIAALRQRLDNEPAPKTDTIVPLVNEFNVVRRELRQQLVAAEVDLASVKAQDVSLEFSAGQIREELRALGQVELRLHDLERKLAVEQDAYRLYTHNREQARIAANLATAELADLQIANPASLPLSSIRPRRLLYLGIALGGSIVLALAAAFFAEHNDRSITSAEQAARMFGVPFIVSFPDLASLERIRRRSEADESR